MRLTKVENEVFEKYKDNKNHLFKYIKKLRKSKDSIGPLKKNNKVIDEEVAITLAKQYASVFSIPLKNYKIDDIEQFFTTPEECNHCKNEVVHICGEDLGAFKSRNVPMLADIVVSKSDIKRAMRKIDQSNSCGPDDLPSLLFIGT